MAPQPIRARVISALFYDKSFLLLLLLLLFLFLLFLFLFLLEV